MAADSGMETCPSPEIPDSRKRPLDGDVENGTTKRSHYGGGGDGSFHFKLLVPSVAAGAIIGKGGETIAQLQKDTCARVKMSKANDFYPGTTERVCLITGSLDAIMSVLVFIMEKIKEKPDPNAKPAIDFDNKTAAEREKQVKILVPNSTAGMVIGKGGNYIKQIKEESGSYVQISQKAKDQTLQERCITVIGDMECNKSACMMILAKVAEDPQSGSCLNVSYADVTGPVANFNPTGSPYASSANQAGPGGPNTNPMQSSAAFSSTGSLNTAIAAVGGLGGMMGHQAGTNIALNGATNSLNLSLNLTPNPAPSMANNPSLTAQLLDHIKVTLRNGGYSDQATAEITAAMSTLATYGILGMGLGLGSGVASGGQHHAPHHHLQPVQSAGYGGGGGASPMDAAPSQAPNGGGGGGGGSGLFGPIGTTASVTTSPTQQPQQRPSSVVVERFVGAPPEGAGGGFDPFRRQPSPTDLSSPPGAGGVKQLPPNNNSFGLATGGQSMAAAVGLCKSPTPGDMKVGGGELKKLELEVGENIVGAILGPGGRSLVEIQHLSGANIQISKKGTFAPGTKNRIVSISGTTNAINNAQYLIEQRISEEEAKRARHNALVGMQ
ncbi:RNA-binding protein Pasilla isoform X2 [Ischnura elegans]|uniref:RNA-binding protein Pasilla isoform X2 n=1 Tax=Ischnura elegans TaxID=197161 RepID=UPI001ED89EFC|nr:RNA-binding protein Pasilla isoform X2 [Ischnura elegans]